MECEPQRLDEIGAGLQYETETPIKRRKTDDEETVGLGTKITDSQKTDPECRQDTPPNLRSNDATMLAELMHEAVQSNRETQHFEITQCNVMSSVINIQLIDALNNQNSSFSACISAQEIQNSSGANVDPPSLVSESFQASLQSQTPADSSAHQAAASACAVTTLSSVVDDFLANAASLPAHSACISAQEIQNSSGANVDPPSLVSESFQASFQPLLAHHHLQFGAQSMEDLSEITHLSDDLDEKQTCSSQKKSSTKPFVTSKVDAPVASGQKVVGKNLHANFSKTAEKQNPDRVQAHVNLALVSKHDVGAIAAVKDMMSLAAAADSFRLVLELFFGAMQLGIQLDVSFICRDLLKMVISTNQIETLLAFFYAIIEVDQHMLQASYTLPFRNLCGGSC
jgi:hypothetical protein